MTEIMVATNYKFLKTIKALKSSVFEQFVLLGVGMLFSILISSRLPLLNIGWVKYILETVLITVFLGSIQIVFDTAYSIFIIAGIKPDLKDEEQFRH
ncbi:MAG: hypothetical protein ACYCVX_15440 [Thiobacillus sp.]